MTAVQRLSEAVGGKEGDPRARDEACELRQRGVCGSVGKQHRCKELIRNVDRQHCLPGQESFTEQLTGEYLSAAAPSSENASP